MKKPIAIGLSPNTTSEDVWLSIKLFFMPWLYMQGESVKSLEKWFRNYFATSHAISFDSARSALYAVLHTLDIGQGDEVLLQAFTCVVVPNAVIAAGGTPIYIDVNESYTMEPGEIEKKITKKTKGIIVQHTFGIPADMGKIVPIAKKHNLFLIEDCACTIGGKYGDKKLGMFGHAAVYSFGRDKAFSSVYGGVAIVRHEKLGKKLRLYQKQKNYPSYFFVAQQLWYSVISLWILSSYYFFSFGRILHYALRKMHFFSFPLEPDEKKGIFNPRNVKKYPNALAALALNQLKQIEVKNKRREAIGNKYNSAIIAFKDKYKYSNIPWLRFPVLVADKRKAIAFFAKKGIFIGDWYTQAIDPKNVNMEKVYYKKGTCPNAEKYAEHIINLPTYPKMSDNDRDKVIEMYKKVSDMGDQTF